MNVKTKAAELESELVFELKGALDLRQLEELKRKFLGKKSFIKMAFKDLKSLPPGEREVVAQILNDAKLRCEELIDGAVADMTSRDIEARINDEWIDTTLPGVLSRCGGIHPVTLVEERCLEVMRQLGFSVVDGPEVESEFFNFDALNMPKHHPARDMQDTFFVKGGGVLRTHTTNVQARLLSTRRAPPIMVASRGRVYRNENVDATHLAMFHQLEGVWVDRGVTFAQLKWTLRFIASTLYGSDHKFRFKPKYYPYTEPSLGMDIQCTACSGAGCGACHGAGWVTIIGAGMIHPNVFRTFGYDPQEVSGFAFGWGTTRMAAQLVGVSRVKSLYEQDVRFLKALYWGKQ